KISPHIDQYTMTDGRRLFLLAEGRLVNLRCAEGHPSDVMDLSFSLQALCVRYINQKRGRLPKAVIPVPEDIDRCVAELKLNSMGVSVEPLTEEQKKYLSSWEHGTG
ncbi:MAG: adenosylhomocysteinase, partial [Candidatus Bathyarchaeia archaeon]